MWIYRRSKKINLAKDALDLSLVLIVSGLIGARISHVVIEYPTYYIENPLAILKIYQGGFVFYGGFIFALIAGWGFLALRKQKISIFLNLFAPVIPLGYGLGRLGCFLAGCCFGKQTSSIFAITKGDVGIHPTQLYSSFSGFLIMTIILYMEKNKVEGRFFAYLILYGISRIWIESLRGDYRGDYYFSTLVSVLAVLFGLAAFVNNRFFKIPPKKEA